MGFLFWLIGGCFSLFGLFLLFAAFTEFGARESSPDTENSKSYLVRALMGIACQGVMVAFFKFKP